MVCSQCQSEMMKDCIAHVEGGMYGIRIIKKRRGIFNNVSQKTKAAVCPNCGYVAFYVENFKAFQNNE